MYFVRDNSDGMTMFQGSYEECERWIAEWGELHPFEIVEFKR